MRFSFPDWRHKRRTERRAALHVAAAVRSGAGAAPLRSGSGSAQERERPAVVQT